MQTIQKLRSTSRIVCFVIVGGVCFLIQLGILKILVAMTNISMTLANSIGFASSAQLNFVFSYRYTWRDTKRLKLRREFFRPWCSFNTATLVALVVNTFVFAVVLNFVGPIPSAVIALACGTVISFAFNHHLTFRNIPTSTS